MRIRKKTIGLIVAAFVVVMAICRRRFAETGTADESTGLVGGVCRGIGSMGTAIADLFGMTPDELAAARKVGQSLADLAQKQGVEQQTLVDTMLAERKELLERSSGERSSDPGTGRRHARAHDHANPGTGRGPLRRASW